MDRITFHILDENIRRRAEIARAVLDSGFHAEPYSELSEIIAHPPRDGIVLIPRDESTPNTSDIAKVLADSGIWLPFVIASENPGVRDIVDGVRAGAIDYLELPVMPVALQGAADRTRSKEGRLTEMRRRQHDARRRVDNLTDREKTVLAAISDGRSNKSIAKEFDLSPRTVETHRRNMMSKLNVSHIHEAIRLAIEVEKDIYSSPSREDVPKDP